MCQFEQDSFILKFLIVTMDKSPPAFASWDGEQRDSMLPPSPRRNNTGCPTPPSAQAGQGKGLEKL